MTEYSYGDDQPTWSNAYLWPPLLAILGEVAPPPRTLFELGCGNGATARLLASKGYEVTGVDPSQSGIALASPHETPSLHFALGSTADDMAATYGTYDVVVSLEVIEHCTSAREFMSRFSALMKPGGIGVISTPYHGLLKNLAVIASGQFDHHFDPLWEGGHLKFFSEAKLGELFREFGFTSCQFHRVGRVSVLAKSTLAVLRK